MTSINNTEEILVYAFCKAWNNLDISYLENHLSDDFEYDSQMVLVTMEGKAAYLDFLKHKFIAIKLGDDPVSAELAYFKGTPCMVIVQYLTIAEKALYRQVVLGDDGEFDTVSVITNVRGATMQFKFEGDKIKSAIMCTIPGINDVKRTGIYPK